MSDLNAAVSSAGAVVVRRKARTTLAQGSIVDFDKSSAFTNSEYVETGSYVAGLPELKIGDNAVDDVRNIYAFRDILIVLCTPYNGGRSVCTFKRVETGKYLYVDMIPFPDSSGNYAIYPFGENHVVGDESRWYITTRDRKRFFAVSPTGQIRTSVDISEGYYNPTAPIDDDHVANFRVVFGDTMYLDVSAVFSGVGGSGSYEITLPNIQRSTMMGAVCCGNGVVALVRLYSPNTTSTVQITTIRFNESYTPTIIGTASSTSFNRYTFYGGRGARYHRLSDGRFCLYGYDSAKSKAGKVIFSVDGSGRVSGVEVEIHDRAELYYNERAKIETVGRSCHVLSGHNVPVAEYQPGPALEYANVTYCPIDADGATQRLVIMGSAYPNIDTKLMAMTEGAINPSQNMVNANVVVKDMSHMGIVLNSPSAGEDAEVAVAGIVNATFAKAGDKYFAPTATISTSATSPENGFLSVTPYTESDSKWITVFDGTISFNTLNAFSNTEEMITTTTDDKYLTRFHDTFARDDIIATKIIYYDANAKFMLRRDWNSNGSLFVGAWVDEKYRGHMVSCSTIDNNIVANTTYPIEYKGVFARIVSAKTGIITAPKYERTYLPIIGCTISQNSADKYFDITGTIRAKILIMYA